MASQAQATPAPLPDEISHNYVIFITVASIMTFLATMIVVLRITTRVLTISAKWDDWACAGALIFAYGFLTTTVLVATVGRAGYQITQYDLATLGKWSQICLANNVLYNNSVTLSKISILLLYRRIFTVSKTLHTASWVVGSVVVGSYFAAVFGLIFTTNPVHAQWQPWIPHTSIHSKAFWIAMGAINVALDIAILCLPQPVVWGLKQTRKRKVLVSLVFAMGGFVCIASIVRLYYMATIDVANVTLTMSVPGMWTMIEMNMTILCACFPIVPSMLKCYRQQRSKHNSHHSGSHGASKSLGSGSASSKACLIPNGSSLTGSAVQQPSGIQLLKIPPTGSSASSVRQDMYHHTTTDIGPGADLETGRLENPRVVHVMTDLEVSYRDRVR
ncbi:hypothetical protein BDW62DRAFT_218351 [Aspergillus aurantiobrunneus]